VYACCAYARYIQKCDVTSVVTQMNSLGRRGIGACLVTSTLSYFGLLNVPQEPFEVKPVNADGDLLEEWESDHNLSMAPECRWLDGSTKYTSEACSWFIINRRSSTPTEAFTRALRCAAHTGVDCVLSPEVGLGTPACFIVGQTATRMVLAPRVIPQEAQESANVRIINPGNTLSTKTVRLNETIQVEYLDGSTRRVVMETFYGREAYCVQFLRMAFNDSCWDSLD
jgi:hypothetical protein